MSVDYANDTQERHIPSDAMVGPRRAVRRARGALKVGSPSALDEILRAVMIVSS